MSIYIQGLGDVGKVPVNTISYNGENLMVIAGATEQFIEDGALKVASETWSEVTAGSYVSYLIEAGNPTAIHLGFTVAAGADSVIYFYRDTGFSGGVVLPEYNRNGFFPDDCAGLVIRSAPSDSDLGTLVYSTLVPGGTKTNSSPGATRLWQFGWILKNNSKYLLRVRNISADGTPISVQFDWHVHTY